MAANYEHAHLRTTGFLKQPGVSLTMNTAIVGIVDFCARRRWMVIVAGLLLLLGTASYAAARFSINTDIEGLISEKLPWHERQVQLSQAFPQRGISAAAK